MNRHIHPALAVCSVCFIASFSPAADVPANTVDVTIEIYELPQVSAYAIQKTFADGAGTERAGILRKLRSNPPPAGVKTIANGHGPCTVGMKSVVAATKDYRYPTAWSLGAVAKPAGNGNMRILGWSAELELSAVGAAGTYEMAASIRSVRLDGSRHFRVSKGDAKGSVEVPYFDMERFNADCRLVAGVTKLIGIYSPFTEGQPGNSLCVVFATVKSGR